MQRALEDGRKQQAERHRLLSTSLMSEGIPAHADVGLQAGPGDVGNPDYWALRAGMAEAALLQLFRRKT